MARSMDSDGDGIFLSALRNAFLKHIDCGLKILVTHTLFVQGQYGREEGFKCEFTILCCDWWVCVIVCTK